MAKIEEKDRIFQESLKKEAERKQQQKSDNPELFALNEKLDAEETAASRRKSISSMLLAILDHFLYDQGYMNAASSLVKTAFKKILTEDFERIDTALNRVEDRMLVYFLIHEITLSWISSGKYQASDTVRLETVNIYNKALREMTKEGRKLNLF